MRNITPSFLSSKLTNNCQRDFPLSIIIIINCLIDREINCSSILRNGLNISSSIQSFLRLKKTLSVDYLCLIDFINANSVDGFNSYIRRRRMWTMCTVLLLFLVEMPSLTSSRATQSSNHSPSKSRKVVGIENISFLKCRYG